MHRIRIAFGPRDDAQYWHRIGNFKDDLYRQIELGGMGTVADINCTAPPVFVTVHHSRDLGRALTIIKKELRRHNFASEAVITRE